MHIGIKANLLSQEHPRGPGSYTTNLIKSLSEIDLENQYTLYVRKLPKDYAITNRNFQLEVLPSPCDFIWGEINMPIRLFLHRPDILFVPMYVVPKFSPCKVVSTIHDMAWFSFSKAKFSKIGKFRLLYAAKHADKIIAVSEFTKREIIKYCKLDPSKIHVIYNGCDNNIFKPEREKTRIEEVKKKYGIPNSYVLYAGTLDRNKNIPKLIEAFRSLKGEKKIRHTLVLAGEAVPTSQEIFFLVDKFGLRGEVIFTGYIPLQDSPVLLSGADLFVFPSLYEGFGLPPLEAMACGTPVIVSNATSLPEVVGDAGLAFDPYDSQELAKAIYQVLSNFELRRNLSQKGIERAKLFSWRRTARETLSVFEEVYREVKQGKDENRNHNRPIGY